MPSEPIWSLESYSHIASYKAQLVDPLWPNIFHIWPSVTLHVQTFHAFAAILRCFLLVDWLSGAHKTLPSVREYSAKKSRRHGARVTETASLPSFS
jgi:hypothetical protein